MPTLSLQSRSPGICNTFLPAPCSVPGSVNVWTRTGKMSPAETYCKYRVTGDILPVLVQALTEPGTEQGAGAGGQGGLPGVGPSPGQGGLQQRPKGTDLASSY